MWRRRPSSADSADSDLRRAEYGIDELFAGARYLLDNRRPVVQPLYAGGGITSRYRLAWAQRDEAELDYKQTVQQAFEDVSNSLVGYAQSGKYRMELAEQTATYKETARLANVRFQGGATSFLEVLTTQQQYFISELNLQQAWAAELQNYVALYQALGGGWQQ